jgi:hypothetical protein
VRSLCVSLLVLAACGRDHGPPRVQPTKEFQATSGPPLRAGGPALSPRNASYKIDARLDATRHQITATEMLTWTNTGESSVDLLPFHLYMNAFKNESTLFMRGARGMMRGAKASDTGWGWIQVDSVMVGQTELLPKLRYPGAPGDLPGLADQTVVELPLDKPVGPNETI